MDLEGRRTMARVLLENETLRALAGGASSSDQAKRLARELIEEGSQAEVDATLVALERARRRWADLGLPALQRVMGCLVEWRNSTGTLVLDIPQPYVERIAVAGICGKSAVNLSGAISDQLDMLDTDEIRREVAEHIEGLTTEMLADDSENRARLVWHACASLWAQWEQASNASVR